MQRYFKTLIALTFFWSLSIFASHLPHITSIQLPDGSIQEVKSPYPIYSPTEKERKEAIFLPENCYAIIKKNSPVKAAVVGPLYPCFFIAVHDPVDQQSIVFHKHKENRDAHIIELIRTKLDNKNKGEFIFHMFTKELDRLTDDKKTPDETLQQKENFEQTFKALCAAFKPSNSRFKARFYKLTTSTAIPEKYFALERWIYFSANKLYSYAPFKEKLLRANYPSLKLIDQILLSISDYDKILLHYNPDQSFELQRDETLEFVDLSEHVGLDSLYSITNPPTPYTSSEEMD